MIPKWRGNHVVSPGVVSEDMVILSYVLVDIGRCSIFMVIYDICVVYPHVSQLKRALNIFEKAVSSHGAEWDDLLSVAIIFEWNLMLNAVNPMPPIWTTPIWTGFWVNLITTEPCSPEPWKSWLGFGKSSPFMAQQFRWVNYYYYYLPRFMMILGMV